MNSIDFEAISAIFYSILLIFYFLLGLLSVFLLIKKAILVLIRKVREKGRSAQKVKYPPLHDLLKTSLLFNNFLALLSIVILFVAIKLLNIDFSLKLGLSAIVLSAIPFVWGYWKSANVGVVSGTIGAFWGLLIIFFNQPLEQVIAEIHWAFLLNLIANQSGWLGGVISQYGKEKKRDSFLVSTINLCLLRDGIDLDKVVSITKSTIERELHLSKLKFKLRPPDTEMMLIEFLSSTKNEFILPNLHFELVWERKIYPPLEIAKGLLKMKGWDLSTNEILDSAFNLQRTQIVKVSVVHNSNFLLEKGEQHNTYSDLQIVITCMTETPSIQWVDQEMRKVFEQIIPKLQSVLEGKNNSLWNITSSRQAIFYFWYPSPSLEQYAKGTITIGNPIETARKAIFETEGNMLDLFHEIVQKKPTIRKNKIAQFYLFLLPLIGEIGFGLFMSWLTNNISKLISIFRM